MKTLIIVLSVFLAVNSMASAQEAVKSSQKEMHKEMYSCPMHPKEMSSKEGECSKCGMKLVKTLQHDTSGKGKKTEVVTKYVCKMDGTTADKPGKCSKCGMKMTPQDVQKPAYSCPMHPKEMSDKPAKCPKCGMQMTPKKSDKKEENHQH
ncbi:heavy metal-binding domain-containing protein [Flavobacterium sp. XS2P24]|uniref:heavy metal-binding domain-containing protein n=1 Tax=Flavobacterium sp. XS2P24 TaxID=3041249 RepID=UPI0024A84AEC|nr:heavy metal-binding domain-containing protein [Flavobacterium sp. XS2P24]MDI6048640.1 heavy metal-binding domain-containing protein [Flavobacterium sp. XS2P24]